MSFYASYPAQINDIQRYANLAAFPSAITAGNGALALALDTDFLYVSNGTTWVLLADGAVGSVTSVAMTVPTFLQVAGSPITSAGTLAVTLSGTALPITSGGTGQVTAAAAFNALSPMTTTGDMVYDSSAATAARLAIGSTGNVLTVAGGIPSWAPPATSGTVTSVAMTVPTFLSIAGSPVTSSGTLAVSLSGTALPATSGGTGVTSLGSLTEATSSVLTITGGTGSVINATSIQVKLAATAQSGYLSSTDWNTFNNKQGSGSYITALTGDVTASGPGSVAATLAATSNATLVTLSALTTAGSLATVGTITAGTWSATTIALNKGGTGQTTAPAAFSALSPITTTGDIIYSSSGTTNSRLAIGSTGNVLTVAGGIPSWAPPATSGTVTSVAMTVPSFLSIAGSPVTSSGTLAVSLSGTALPVLNGGTGVTTSTGTGSVVLNSSPALTTPVTTGVTNGSDAASGIVGEQLIQTRVLSAATALTTSNVEYNVLATALTLTAGDWEISGTACWGSSSATITVLRAGVSLTSATLPASDTIGVPTGGEYRVHSPSYAVVASITQTAAIPPFKVSISGSTTYYLVASAAFSAGSMTTWGTLRARRMR